MRRILTILAVAITTAALIMATALPVLALEPSTQGFGDGGVQSSDTSPSGLCGTGHGQGNFTFQGGFDAGGAGTGGSCFDGDPTDPAVGSGTGVGELCQGHVDPDPQIPGRCVGK